VPRVSNPFRPGFNQAPTELAGRDDVIAAFREALDVAALDGRTPRPIVLTGGRGVGKTVLLGEVAALAAEEHSWLTVPVEVRAGRPLIGQLIERLGAARDLYAHSRERRLQMTGAKVRATVLGVGAEVEVARRDPEPDEPSLDRVLAGAAAAALDKEAGLVVTVDELQLAARTDLSEFVAVLQQHVPDDWPLVVVLAGLPGVRDANKGVTYLERAEWHVLGLLDPVATRRALTEPAERSGRPMTDEAATLLAEASGGYPYAIQVMGHHAWRASVGSDKIDLAAARTALVAADRDLAAGLYESRWADASPREREYLKALADLFEQHSDVGGGEVAAALGKAAREVSYLRERLLQKGTLFADNGHLQFAVPGMAQWLLARISPA
jgi:AAA ATPase domain